MKYKLFTVAGVPCSIHAGTIAFALYMLLVGKLRMFILSVLSILLHEGAHTVTAACFGQRPRRVELTPLGAMVNLDDDEQLPPLKRLLVLLSGPVASLLICLVARWAYNRGVLQRDTFQLFGCNLLLLLLNLLPVLPLDGGRIAALFLSLVLPADRLRFLLRLVGTVLGSGLIIINLILCLTIGGWNLSLGMTGCFLLYSAAAGTSPYALTELRMLMERKIQLERSGALRCQTLAVLETTPLQQVINQLKPRRYTQLVILQSGTHNELSISNESALVAAYLAKPWDSCSCLVK